MSSDITPAPSAAGSGPTPSEGVSTPPSADGEPVGRVVATERRPNTAFEFHFWTALDAPIGIGTIVRVDGDTAINGTIPVVYGVVTEGFATPTCSRRCTTYWGTTACPAAPPPVPPSGPRSACTPRRCCGSCPRSRCSRCPWARCAWRATRTSPSPCAWTASCATGSAPGSRWACTAPAAPSRRSTSTPTSCSGPRRRTSTSPACRGWRRRRARWSGCSPRCSRTFRHPRARWRPSAST